MKRISRRKALKLLGTAATGAGLYARSGLAAPSLHKGTVFTVSTWGGVTQDTVAKHMAAEFTRATGATFAFDIGSQGQRYSKLMAQRAHPVADVFFGADDAQISGLKAGILTPVARKGLPNLGDVEEWALTVKTADAATVGAVPCCLIAYLIGYNPETVKTPIASWNDLWRPEFAGKLAFASPFHSMMPMIVTMVAEMAGGSMSNPDPGFKKLAELRPAKLGFTWTDWAALYKSGDVIVATEFDCYLDVMKTQGYGVQYVVPKEKGIASIDCVGAVKGRPNADLQEYFLDLVTSPAVQEGFATDLFQGPINRKVKLAADLQAKCSCGARVADLRFFDPTQVAALRPAWTERMNTEVVPHWGTR